MPSAKRQGNRPGRRLAPEGFLDEKAIELLVGKLRYVGSSLHKLRPGDYGLVPPTNPRPSKSPCDDLRSILSHEAMELFRKGIKLGMVSEFPPGGAPKYVWAVDDDGQVYEAKTKPERETDYHGYRIGEDEPQVRKYILGEWSKRCLKDSK